VRKIFFILLWSHTAVSCFQEKPVASTKITVDKKIIEKIIEDLLYLDNNDDDETTLEATKKRS
jgi:hypothetical protein